MTEINYLAVTNPEDPAAMTFWRIDQQGRLVEWPTRASYGPALWKVPGPGRSHVVPVGLRGNDRKAWVRAWHGTVRAEWLARVRAVIDADPIAAGATFAALATRCTRCGKSLDDPASRSRALGSECVSRFPDHVIAAFCREVGRAFAAYLDGDDARALISRTAVYTDAAGRLAGEEPA